MGFDVGTIVILFYRWRPWGTKLEKLAQSAIGGQVFECRLSGSTARQPLNYFCSGQSLRYYDFKNIFFFNPLRHNFYPLAIFVLILKYMLASFLLMLKYF